jgi:ABC-type multidrug transport system fused ATPase/permease subunit
LFLYSGSAKPKYMETDSRKPKLPLVDSKEPYIPPVNEPSFSPENTQKNGKSPLRRFMDYVRPYAGLIFLATLCGVLKFTLPATLAVATRFVMDRLLPNLTTPEEHFDPSFRFTLNYLDWAATRLPEAWNTDTPMGQLSVLTATLLVVYLLWGISSYYRSYLSALAGHRVILDLRTDLYAHITRLSHSFFQSNQSGGIVSRLMSDIALAQNFVGSAMTAIWMDAASCILYIWLMWTMDPSMTIAALGIFPFYIAAMRTFGKRAKSTTKHVQEALEEFSGDIQERVAGIAVVKSFATEARESRTFFHGARGIYDLTLKSVRVTAMAQTITQWLTQNAQLLLLWYGGYRVLAGQTSPGTVVAFTLLVRELYNPMNRISDMNTVLNNSLAAIERVFEVFDISADVKQKNDAKRLPRIKGRITFESVTFGYSPEQPVIRNLNLDIKPGEVVALVGSSGAGKSTLVQLVPRFFDPQIGRVLIDGLEVRDVHLRSLRSQIGIVAQETLLFSGSVRDNLLYGRPDATDEEIERAAQAAHIKDFVSELTEGYDTLLGERGAKLSGGQKQRIAIARAFLCNPRILILDEATSALDSESEALIQDALAELMKGRTSIVIAHRLSTILGADRIAVMDKGQLVDIAPHDVLLERCKLYANLYHTQFKVALAS